MPSPLENLTGPGQPLRREAAGEYEGGLDVDEQLIADVITACKKVASALGKLPRL